MGTFLLYLSSALILVWTVQLARSKGRNPWLWGGASLLFMLFGFTDSSLRLAGLAPLLFLLFFRVPRPKKTEDAAATETPATLSCPRCHSSQPNTQRYCVNCGWELRKPYNEERQKQEDKSNAPSRLEPMRAANTNAHPEVAEAQEHPAEANSTKVEPAAPYREPATAEEEPQAEPSEPVRVYSGPPTARKMTERGLSLLNQGRSQEAIDQFTKAIALDHNYREAWQRRAEAYERLGRNNEADQDRRTLEAI